MGILNTILDIIFPIRCVVCGISGFDLCLSCLSGSPEAERESASWIFPLYDYRHPPVKKALSLLKYRGKKRLARVFAQAMHGRILEELADLRVMENFREPVLIPIPLSKPRYRARGFNQSELICRELSLLGPDLALEKNVLMKPRETVHQAHIENRSERLKNIVGSFSIQNEDWIKERIQGKNIILIDDITTTGATLSEAKKILKAAGVRKVIAFTVAH